MSIKLWAPYVDENPPGLFHSITTCDCIACRYERAQYGGFKKRIKKRRKYESRQQTTER